MKKRISVLFLIAAMLLAGCGSEPTPDETETVPAETESEPSGDSTAEREKEIVFEERDYGGYAFRMLTRPDEYVLEVYIPEITGDIVNDAVFNRNASIEELYNIVFQISESSSQWETDGLMGILAGEDEYDLIFTHARCAFTYAQNGAVMDWRTLPHVNLTEEYWSQDCYKNLSFNNRTYAMTGDMSYADFAATECMMFNKKILDDHGMEYPYEMVLDGTWTFDAFAEMARQLHVDLNADGKMTIRDDQFGYATSHWTGAYSALYSTGERLMTVIDGMPEITVYNEKTVEIFDKYLALANEECSWKQTTDTPEYSYLEAFCAGRAAFMDCSLKYLSEGQFRDMETEFGIVPWPKYTEDTEKYYAFVDAGSTLCVVPVTNTDFDRAGLVLETMAVLGQDMITPAYYEKALQHKYLRDEYSVAMLDYLRDGRTVDLGYYNKEFSGDLANIPKDLVDDDRLTLTVRFEQIHEAVQAKMENAVSYYFE